MDDSTVSGRLPHAWPYRAADRALRALFVATVAAAGLLFWLAPHPPMVDLPQHAAQVATLHDMLRGQSPWAPLLRINLFTPYLLGYGAAAALSFVMPVTAAFKVMLTLSLYGFVAAYVALRRRLGTDPRLDWLCVPGFFGFAYEFGLYSYLVATPVAMVFLALALDYAEQPTFRRGAVLALVNLALFFSHGLIFVFANAIGGLFLLVRRPRTFSRALLAAWPYAVLALVTVLYALVHRDVDLAPMYPFTVIWTINPLARILSAMFYPWGITSDNGLLLAFLLIVAAPFLMASKANRHVTAYVPALVVTIVWFGVPLFAINTFFLFPRFAMFLLPFYALMFRAPVQAESGRAGTPWLVLMTQLILAGICAGFVAQQGVRVVRFADESADFDVVANAIEPAQRGLGIIVDRASVAADNPFVYENFPVWYQAEHGGFVDFNAARFPPQIVRFRLDQLPGVGPSDVSPLPLYRHFNWQRHQGRLYRYFFVRAETPLPDAFFANPDCRVVRVKTAGEWSVYEKQACRSD
ncbi:hypothetical protein LMA00_00125 [Burkholderia ambifaria]|uniref:hypothetical protein n=1 Tax=Burkholderia ambifaria TaxID=152480 RepID=UPI001E524C04|nr:hypothetical protein [Burkholderia ambifaria]UEP48216.1 hypothetical protein LMA00_00125 [Burkholderia ambifaria]